MRYINDVAYDFKINDKNGVNITAMHNLNSEMYIIDRPIKHLETIITNLTKILNEAKELENKLK